MRDLLLVGMRSRRQPGAVAPSLALNLSPRTAMLGVTLLGALFCFASLWATGANDVANALGAAARAARAHRPHRRPLQAPLWAARP